MIIKCSKGTFPIRVLLLVSGSALWRRKYATQIHVTSRFSSMASRRDASWCASNTITVTPLMVTHTHHRPSHVSVTLRLRIKITADVTFVFVKMLFPFELMIDDNHLETLLPEKGKINVLIFWRSQTMAVSIQRSVLCLSFNSLQFSVKCYIVLFR